MTPQELSDRATEHAMHGPVVEARPELCTQSRVPGGHPNSPAAAGRAAAGVGEAEVLSLWEAGESVADIAGALNADRHEVLNLIRGWMGRQPVRTPSVARPPAQRSQFRQPTPPRTEHASYARQTSPRSMTLTPAGLVAIGAAVDSAGLELVAVPLLTKAGAQQIAAQHGWTR